MVKPVAHNGPDAGSNPALTTSETPDRANGVRTSAKGDSSTTTNEVRTSANEVRTSANIKKGDRVMVWHVKGGWKRMKVVSIGYKWLKVKYISKRIRHLKLPVSEIGRFVKEI